MLFKTAVWIFLIVGVVHKPVFSQDGSNLRVLVVSGYDGSPLTGANVLLYDFYRASDYAVPVLFCITNTDGFCEIKSIPPEQDFELVISYIGHVSYRSALSFHPYERLVMRTVLESDLTVIDEVVVRDNRYITTGEAGIYRISSSDIFRVPSPVSGGDVSTYLQTLPGIVTASDRGGDLYIRGGTPDQNLILVDNLPIFKPFHIYNLFSAFSGDVVQNIALFAGGFDARYTGATSAVVDVALRPGNMRNFKASVSSSPYLTALLMEGPIEIDRQSYLIKARTSVIDRFGKTITGSHIPVYFSDLVGRYTISDKNITCNITGVYTHDRGEITPDRDLTHTWTNTVAGVRCLGYSDVLNHPVDISFGHSNYQNSERSPVKRERFSSINQYFLQSKLQFDLGKQAFDYGYGIVFRTYRINLDEQFTRFTSIGNLERTIPIINFYVSSLWSLTPRLRIQPGYATQFTLDIPFTVEPRLRLAWQANESGTSNLSVAIGRYVQTYSGISDERDAGTVFTVLKPVEEGEPLPSAVHAVVGWHYQDGTGIEAHFETFVKSHKHIPVSKWTPEPRLEIETARANGNTHGFDTRFSFDKGIWYASVGYGWSRVHYKAASDDLGAWIEDALLEYAPAHDQRHKVNLIGSYRFRGFTLNTNWEYHSGAPFTQLFGYDFYVSLPVQRPESDAGSARLFYNRPYGNRLPSYHRLDVALERTIELPAQTFLQLSVGIINVYNRRNIVNFDANTLRRVNQTPFFPYFNLKLGL